MGFAVSAINPAQLTARTETHRLVFGNGLESQQLTEVMINRPRYQES